MDTDRPGTYLAVATVLLGTLYWLVFAGCSAQDAKHLFVHASAFTAHRWLFLAIGIALPAIGLGGCVLNAIHGRDRDLSRFSLGVMLGLLLLGIPVSGWMIGALFTETQPHGLLLYYGPPK